MVFPEAPQICSMICLRPHHGMCLAYFEGKGYSDGFTVNMTEDAGVF